MSWGYYEKSEFMEAWIKTKGLWKEYQSAEKEEKRKRHDTELRFTMDKYRFTITLSRWQWDVVSEWAETLSDDWEWKYCNRTFLGERKYEDKYTDVLITGKDVKTIFKLFADDKIKSYANPDLKLKVDCRWGNNLSVIEEFHDCSWYADDESRWVGEDFIGVGENWAYKQKKYRDDYSSIFNIEDK